MEKYISAEAAEAAFRQLIIASGKPQGIYHERTYLDGIAESRNAIRSIAPADVVDVVRCKNCKHRPVVVNPSRPYGFGLAGPGSDPFCRDETCPYLCDDGYYNRMPDDDGFCNLGEVKDG